MNLKPAFTSLGTGALVSLVLYYPLYLVLPGAYVKGWPVASEIVGQGAFFLAGLLLLAGGYLAARQFSGATRVQNLLAGLAAGGFASLCAYWVLGAPAAGVYGARSMLQLGLNAAADDFEFLSQLVEAVIQVTWWTSQTMWNMTFIGMLLGAIGGVLTPSSASHEAGTSWPVTLSLSVAVAGTLAAVLNLIVVVAILALLPVSVQETITEIGYTPSLPVSSVRDYPLVSSLVIYLAFLAWLWQLGRRIKGAEYTWDVLSSASVGVTSGGLISLGAVVMMIVADNTIIGNAYFLVGGLLSVILSVLMLADGRAIWRRMQANKPAKGTMPAWMDQSPFDLLKNSSGLGLGVMAAMMIPTFDSFLQMSLNLVMVPIALIQYQANYGENYREIVLDTTLVEIVRELYRIHFWAIPAAILGIALVTLVGTYLLVWFLKRFAFKQ